MLWHVSDRVSGVCRLYSWAPEEAGDGLQGHLILIGQDWRAPDHLPSTAPAQPQELLGARVPVRKCPGDAGPAPALLERAVQSKVRALCAPSRQRRRPEQQAAPQPRQRRSRLPGYERLA
jgi:hypothetical protein